MVSFHTKVKNNVIMSIKLRNSPVCLVTHQNTPEAYLEDAPSTDKIKQYSGKITLQLTATEGSHLSLKNWIPTSVGQKTQASINSC